MPLVLDSLSPLGFASARMSWHATAALSAHTPLVGRVVTGNVFIGSVGWLALAKDADRDTHARKDRFAGGNMSANFRIRSVVVPLILLLASVRLHSQTMLDFQGVDASAPPGNVDATSYLSNFGITLSGVTPGTQVVVLNNNFLYGGGTAIPTHPPNLLSQFGSNITMSFTLNFANPVANVTITRPELIAGSSGITHPSWIATAFDQANATGNQLASVGEGLIASFSNVPAATKTLGVSNIQSIRIDSDNAHFTAFGAVLIGEITFVSASPTPTPTPPPTCHDVVSNSVNVTPTDGTLVSGASIKAIFTPNLGLSLSDAAKACGVDHFNWLSVITGADSLQTSNALRNQFGALPTVPFVDPPKGGYFRDCEYAFASVQPDGTLATVCPVLPTALPTADPIWGPKAKPKPTAVVADEFPWYWDEVVPAINYSSGGFIGPKPESAGHPADFSDAPCSHVPGDEIDFFTVLAGVRSDGTGAILNFPGTSFTWTYTSTSVSCGHGGFITDFPKNDGSIPTTGGNIVFKGFVPPDALPSTVLELLESLQIPVVPVLPTTAALTIPTPNPAGWNNTDVIITLIATGSPGGPGVEQITYSATGAQPIESTVVTGSSASIEVVGEGLTTISFFATDNVGDVETPKVVTVRIDKTPPTVSCTANPDVLWPPNGSTVPVTISGIIADGGSGVDSSNAAFLVTDSEGQIQPSGPIMVLPSGGYSFSLPLVAARQGSDKNGRQFVVEVTARDNAGNLGSCSTVVTVPHDQGQ
jgi:hypothetical protein